MLRERPGASNRLLTKGSVSALRGSTPYSPMNLLGAPIGSPRMCSKTPQGWLEASLVGQGTLLHV